MSPLIAFVFLVIGFPIFLTHEATMVVPRVIRMSAAAYPSISSSSPSLNAAQKEAVSCPLNRASICIAGPGSGKTKVLTHRIEHMIKDLNQGPKSILAITFTNKAAMEMKRRLTGLLGEAVASSLTVGTFHSFSCRLLRLYGSDHLKILTGSNAVTGNFSIYDQDECLKIVKELMKKKNILEESLKPASVLDAISNIKEARVMAKCSLSLEGAYSHILSQDGMLILTSRSYKAAEALVFEYDKILHSNNALDFQDLLLCAYKLLGIREVADTVMSRWRHILVDEYQDTNIPQYEIIQALSPPSFLQGSPILETNNQFSNTKAPFQRSLFVVGDKNQAIYSWRGARPSNLASLIRSYPNICKYDLLENYRCSKPITAVANAVLGRIGTQPIQLATNKAEPVRLLYCSDDEDQAKCVTKILSTLMIPKLKPRKFAVLYRTNAQSRSLEQELATQGIKYKLIRGQKFYARREIKDVISCVRIIVNPCDKEAFNRALGLVRGIGDKTRTNFFAWVDSCRYTSLNASKLPSISDLLFSLSSKDSNFMLNRPLTSREKNLLLHLSITLKSLIDISQTGSVTDIVKKVILDLVNSEYLTKISKTMTESEDRKENLNELIKATERYSLESSSIGALPSGQLQAFLEETALSADGDEETDENDETGLSSGKEIGESIVYLMTIHASKGLEFDTVFLTGMEDGILPLTRTDFNKLQPSDIVETEEISEERRLAFVAITRAEKMLFICARKQLRQFSGNGLSIVTNAKLSRFLEPVLERLVGDSDVQVKYF